MSDIRERHAGEHECMGSVGEAIYDPGTPCDAIQQADRADAAEAASMDDAAAIQELGRDLWAARADADRLAEALRNLKASPQTLDSRLRHRAADALRQHDEAAK